MEPSVSASESSAATDSDQDFDPSAEMLVNDFDDEHTLDEEEALEDNDTNEEDDEIDDLQKEGEMPIEELLAMYGYNDKHGNSCDRNVERVEATSTTTTPTEAHSSTDAHNNASHVMGVTIGSSILNSNNNSVHSHVTHLRSSQPFTHMNNQNMVSDTSDSESDDEFSTIEDDWRRTIQVGSDYQASIPEGLSRYDGAPAYENEDRLIWDPSPLEDKAIEEYLLRFQQNSDDDNCHDDDVVSSSLLLPNGSHIRDDEQALFLLHQCGHNVEEALRRRRMSSNLPSINGPMTSWSDEECMAFEAGLRMHGKDFHLVQLNKVRTRSVGELVQFYYLWKKTERHDVFATKFRVEKKKYSLHPGTTDYMDRFLDEQENLALTVQASLSSSSLNNIQSSNKSQLHSYRSSPSTHNSSPITKSDLLMDELSSTYANINNFCDSGGSTGIITGGNITGFVNGYYKTSDNVLCSSVTSVAQSGNSVPKLCHPSIPVARVDTSDWLSSQHSATSTTANINGPDLNVRDADFVRRNAISSTTLSDIHSSLSTSTSNSSSN